MHECHCCENGEESHRDFGLPAASNNELVLYYMHQSTASPWPFNKKGPLQARPIWGASAEAEGERV